MQSLMLKIKGLHTHPSELGNDVPEGALQVADNVVIDKESVAQPRRGFDRLTTGFADVSHRANKLFFYKNKLIAHHFTNLLAYYESGVWTAYSGTYTPVANGNTQSSYTTLKVRAAEANQNFYFTTAGGVKKLDNYNSTPIDAGAYKGLDIQASVPATPTAAWLADDYRVAYRVVWGYRDANNNLLLGAPSQRESVTNTAGGTRDVLLNITVPAGVTTSWFYQVYRSTSVDNSVEEIEPSDELALVYEDNPSSGSFSSYSKTFVDADVNTGSETITIASHGFVDGDVVVFSNSGGALPGNITAGTRYFVIGATTNTFQISTSFGGSAHNISTAAGGGTHTVRGAQQIAVLDITPDELRGATIYTAASQEGLVAGNEAPPLAKDIAVYKNTMFYANTVSKHRYYLTLLSAGGTRGIDNNDTLIIDGVTYTASTSAENANTGTFLVTTSGSAAQNIRDTAVSLVRVINRYSSSTVYAYYLSGPDELPGKILLEERGIGDTAFAITATQSGGAAAECWNPILPTSGTSQSSSNDQFKNGIYFSKTSQPEAVPLSNFFFAGSADSEILRIIPLRDSVFVLKEDGIYRISGEDASSFRVDLFDSTTRLLAPESAVVLNNQIFALTDQGVVAITEGGVQVKSRPIEITLTSLLGEDLDALRNLTFAVSYETERKYILFVPTISGDTTATQAFVYNTFTNTWTRWTLAKTCGAVDPENDVLYLGDAQSNFVNNERKTLSYLDYADYGGVSSITAVSGTTLTLSTVEDVEVGDIIFQSASVLSTVTAVDREFAQVTVAGVRAFTVAACTILKAIDSRISWVPFTMGNPGVLKQFREVSLLFKKDFSGEADLVFSSDVSGSPETEELEGTGSGRWGSFAWGRVPWGGRKKRRPIRVAVPRNKQRCSQLTCEFRHATAFTDYQLNGISLIASPGSERIA